MFGIFVIKLIHELNEQTVVSFAHLNENPCPKEVEVILAKNTSNREIFLIDQILKKFLQ